MAGDGEGGPGDVRPSSRPGTDAAGRVPGPASYVGCLVACFLGLVAVMVGGVLLVLVVFGLGNA